MNHYQTTTDKVLALLPKQEEITMIGGIHLPPNAKRQVDSKSPLSEMLVHSVGPDCKTVKAGDRALYNKHHIDPIPCEDGELVILPEGQILAVVKAVIEKKVEPIAIPIPLRGEPLTIEEVKAGLGIEEKAKDDSSDLPKAAPAAAPVP